ncbi:hypothetical protein [Nostoc sp.]
MGDEGDEGDEGDNAQCPMPNAQCPMPHSLNCKKVFFCPRWCGIFGDHCE